MRVLLVMSVLFAAVIFVNAEMPKDIPEPLVPLAHALKGLIEGLPKLPDGMPDFSKAPAELQVKMHEFKDAYEKGTGNKFPPIPGLK